jgi:hypothetical protein
MMKVIVLVLLSTGLAIGCTSCAHEQLTARQSRRQQAIDTTVLAGATMVGAMIEEQTR